MVEEKIERLWKWFNENEPKIKKSLEEEDSSDQEYIVNQLNELILELGAFSWEIGPGRSKIWSLTISPNQNKDLLDISKSIIQAAPLLQDWQFNYYKPAKDWDRNFSIYDNFMNKIEIDASHWKFAALKDNNGLVEVFIEANNLGHLDSDTALNAIELVVITEIGEELKIENICAIELVEQFQDELLAHRTDIADMKNMIEEMIS